MLALSTAPAAATIREHVTEPQRALPYNTTVKTLYNFQKAALHLLRSMNESADPCDDFCELIMQARKLFVV